MRNILVKQAIKFIGQLFEAFADLARVILLEVGFFAISAVAVVAIFAVGKSFARTAKDIKAFKKFIP